MPPSHRRIAADQDINIAELQATIGANIGRMSERDRLRTIARLVYEKGFDQSHVTKITGLDQPTISRALRRAWEHNLIRFQVIPETHEIAEERLKEILLPRGVRRVIVVPRDVFGGKNVANLSEAGAELLLELIIRHDKSTGPLHITTSCGQTLQETLRRFAEKLREDRDRAAQIQEKEIHFSPATLWGDKNYEISAAYPHTSVTYLHNLLSRDDLLAREFRKMHFFTPTLPAFFQGLTEEQREDFKRKAGILEFVEKAKFAHIILTGIGSTTSEDFQKAHEDEFAPYKDELGKLTRWPEGLDENMGELCYQPINDTGSLANPAFNVVGVTLDDLKQAAGHVLEGRGPMQREEREQHVIAISGGIQKAKQIARVLRLRQLPMNTLITDPDAVTELTRKRDSDRPEGMPSA